MRNALLLFSLKLKKTLLNCFLTANNENVFYTVELSNQIILRYDSFHWKDVIKCSSLKNASMRAQKFYHYLCFGNQKITTFMCS